MFGFGGMNRFGGNGNSNDNNASSGDGSSSSSSEDLIYLQQKQGHNRHQNNNTITAPETILQPHPRSLGPRSSSNSSLSPAVIARRRTSSSSASKASSAIMTTPPGSSSSSGSSGILINVNISHENEDDDDDEHDHYDYDDTSPDEGGTTSSMTSPDSSPSRWYHFSGTGSLAANMTETTAPTPTTTTTTLTKPRYQRRRYSNNSSGNSSSNGNNTHNSGSQQQQQRTLRRHHSRQDSSSSVPRRLSSSSSLFTTPPPPPPPACSRASSSSSVPTSSTSAFPSSRRSSSSSSSIISPLSVSSPSSAEPTTKQRGSIFITNYTAKSWSGVAITFCSMVAVSIVGIILLTNQATTNTNNSLFLPSYYGGGSSLSLTSSTYDDEVTTSVGSNIDKNYQQTATTTKSQKNQKKKKRVKLGGARRRDKTKADEEYLSKIAAVEEGMPMKTTVVSSSHSGSTTTTTAAAGLRGKIVQGRWDRTGTASSSSSGITPSTAGLNKKLVVKPSPPSSSSLSTSNHKKEPISNSDKAEKSIIATSNKKKMAAHATTSLNDNNKDAIAAPSHAPTTNQQSKMNLPPPVPKLPYNYEKVDRRMYDNNKTTRKDRNQQQLESKTSSSTSRSSSSSKNQRGAPYPRVFSFDPSASSSTSSLSGAPPKKVKLYPSDFTDNTQLYGILPSDDERLSRMEIRAPYSDGECVPMQAWQTTYNPSCNGMHELGMDEIGDDNHGVDAKLFGTGGFWRYAWRLDVDLPPKSKEGEGVSSSSKDTVVLKTLKYEHNFEDAHFEHDRIDAVAMERLTASPHVINVFGFCGHSVITEFADGPRVGALADKARKTPLERLQIARDVANGLADVHGIDGDGNATFVHLDVNPANVVSIGGTLKFNDFNIGIIRRWNTTSNEACGFPAQYPNPQWRSPEESREEQNLTEKVDIFSMGHIFFRLINGHEPWNKLEPGGKPSKEEINRKVKQGIMPFIPDEIKNSDDPEIVAIRDAMISCYSHDPKDRPDARGIARSLDRTLTELTAKMKSFPPSPPEGQSTTAEKTNQKVVSTTARKTNKKVGGATVKTKKGTPKVVKKAKKKSVAAATKPT
eukprot:CAMPEP_0113464448 /NCGR_PEP_ID=MMETSP0014_2-20120614/13207_1 /TAXON_ID=2857 /ORGANISM="Nitzschia sp." /LENGTH=1082 /DNA_ID=CAMNT_0000356531 /DNA_START=311 /DNA_END=3556 /DNA_ORIENTATION=- /assembly_acc=CAM_ASM_000159